MEQFNEQFDLYMSKLKEDRDRKDFSKNYAETNKKLVSKYRKCSKPEKKLEIRNKLVILNMKLAHEIFLKELKVNIFKDDSIDILQEINLCLIESIDKILKKRKCKNLSVYLYHYIKKGLKTRIIEKYYEYNSFRKYIPDPDLILAEDTEEKDNKKEAIKRYSIYCLRNRKDYILTEALKETTILELIRYELEPTREGTRQLRKKVIKKMTNLVMEDEKREENKGRISKFLGSHPKIKYVIFNPTAPENFLRNPSEGNYSSLLEKLICKGIDLREWLIVDSKTRDYYVETLGCDKIHHFSISNNFGIDEIRDKYLYQIKEQELGDKVFSFSAYYDFELRSSKKYNDVKKIFKLLGYEYADRYFAGDVSLNYHMNQLKDTSDRFKEIVLLEKILNRRQYLFRCLARKVAIAACLRQL